MRDWSKRLCSTVLAATLLVSNIQPVFAFAAETEDTGLCEHHVTHENCGYVAAATGSDCKHEHDNGCFTVKCTHVHGDCGYVAAVEGVDCDHQHDGACGYAEAVAEVPCTCQQEEHTEDCAYAPAIPEVKCSHIHGECSFVEAKSEIPCGHDCTQDEACGEKVLNCVHRHDESCGYVAAVEGKACEFVCEVCAAEEASAAAVAEVKALMETLPELEAVQIMSMEEQKAAYEQTQAVYEAYGRLTADQQQELVDPEEVFKPLFEYFNTLIDADGEIGSGTPDGTPPTLVSLAITSVTTITAPGTIELVAEATDDVSGIDCVYVGFKGQTNSKWLNGILRSTYWENGTELTYADGKLHGKITVDEYIEADNFVLDSVSVVDVAENAIYYDRNYNEELELVNRFPLTDYMEAMQFSVVEIESADGTPPTLSSLSIASATTITAPGTIELVAEATDDVSGVDCVYVGFKGQTNSKWLNAVLHSTYWENGTELTYADGKLHGKITINQYLESDVFVLDSVSVADIAENATYYDRNYNEELELPNRFPLTDYMEAMQFTVTGSAQADGTPPTVTSLTISTTSITAPGTIELVAEATDDVSGVDCVYVGFKGQTNSKWLNAVLHSTYWENGTELTYADGKLHGKITINQYLESDVFVLDSVSVADIAENATYYDRNYNEALELPNRLPLTDYMNAIQFTVTNVGADITTSTNQSTFVEDVKNAADDAYIVADFSSNSTLPKEAFDGIEGTSKTLDLTSEGVTWRFEGSGITNSTKDIDLSVQISKAESNTSDTGQAIQDKLNDTPGYIMKFAENGELPGKATIQIKVDYAMREHLGSSTGLNVYYYNNQTGKLELVAENLSVINDTYVEFSITHCSYYVLTVASEETVNETVNGTCGANQTWKFNNTTKVLTISGTGSMTDFTMSGSDFMATPTDSPWLEIGDEVREIVIESGVTTIGRGAFAGFSELILVSLPNTLTSIGDHAFNGAASLKGLDIPNSVTYLGDYALCCCVRLASVTLPSGITKIGAYTFDQCWPNSITVPASVITVDSKAFAHGTIGEIIFTGNAPNFADDAFYNQTTTVRYPKNNDTWTDAVKQNYGGTVTWLEVGTDDTEMGDPVFTNASGTWGSNITWVLDENGLLTVSGNGTMAHYSEDNPDADFSSGVLYPWQAYADGITELVVAEGITALANNAFSRLKHMTAVTLPNSLTDMADNTFTSCDSLKNVTLGSGVVDIGQGSFGNCTSLTSIEIPSNVKRIDYYAFDGCKHLKSIAISAGVTTIWKMAFRGCASLTSIDIPASVTLIEESAFESCTGLTTVTIPASVETLGKHVFYNCRNLKEIFFEGDAPQFDLYALLNLTATAYYSSDNATWTADKLKDYGGDITWISRNKCGENAWWEFNPITGALTIYGTGEFTGFYVDGGRKYYWEEYLDDIKKIVVEDGITQIGLFAFDGCKNATEVSIPDSVTEIAYGAFTGCASLETVILPESVPELYLTFNGCRSLKNVTLPTAITSLNGTFMDCSSLESVEIPESVTIIDTMTFIRCTALKEFTVPDQITEIGAVAFLDCTNLKKVTFEGNAPNIWEAIDDHPDGRGAFAGCTLTAYYPAGNTTWTTEVMKQYGGNITWKPYCPNGHTVVTDKAVEATCTATGLTEGKHCSACGEVLTAQTTVSAKGHNYVNGYCSRCGVAAPTSGGSTGGNGSTNNGSSTNTGTGNTGTTTRPTTQPSQNGAELSAKELGASADRNASTTVAVDGVRITFDAKAQKAIADQATKDDIYLNYEEIKEAKLNKDQKKAIKDHLSDHKGQKHVLTFSITLISGGKEIHDFKGGTATVKIPFTPNPGTKGDDYKVFFVDGNGELHPMETAYENGYLVVKLTHFSEYVVFHMPEETAEETTEAIVATEETIAEDEPAAIVSEPVQAVKATKIDNVGMILWIIIALCIVGIVVIGVILLRMRKNKN